MVKYFCDSCVEEIKNRNSHNKCTWCGRDLCHTCLYFDDYSRPTCKFCAHEKSVKVRRTSDPIGSEAYLPTAKSKHPAER